ncbi:MAG: ABC transporter permease subunit [Rhodospirillales bacterium]|nr:ABC transporter permease subunit [Rhodospirillales bacterium]
MTTAADPLLDVAAAPEDTPARRAPLLALAGLAALGFLLIPYAGLALTTDWARLAPEPGDWESVRVSAGETLAALALVLAGGTPLAWWLARRGPRLRPLLDALLLIPLLTPPLAMGLLLAMAYGPYSVPGAFARRLGIELTNTPAAFLLAQIYASAPYYVLAARAAFEGVPREFEDIARTLGRGAWHRFFHVSLPLARLGLATGLALAWVRALGEFGVALIVAYYPQGIPVRLWVDLQDSGLAAVYPLLWVLFAIGLPLPLALGLWARGHHEARPHAS